MKTTKQQMTFRATKPFHDLDTLHVLNNIRKICAMKYN